MSSGLSGLTTLNMHGCEMVTGQGILSICGLINLQHLNLELCNRASGLEHMAGELTSHLCCRTHLLLHTPTVQQISGAADTNIAKSVCCCKVFACIQMMTAHNPSAKLCVHVKRFAVVMQCISCASHCLCTALHMYMGGVWHSICFCRIGPSGKP